MPIPAANTLEAVKTTSITSNSFFIHPPCIVNNFYYYKNNLSQTIRQAFF